MVRIFWKAQRTWILHTGFIFSKGQKTFPIENPVSILNIVLLSQEAHIDSDFRMGVSMNGERQQRPQYTMIFLIGSLISGTPRHGLIRNIDSNPTTFLEHSTGLRCSPFAGEDAEGPLGRHLSEMGPKSRTKPFVGATALETPSNLCLNEELYQTLHLQRLATQSHHVRRLPSIWHC